MRLVEVIVVYFSIGAAFGTHQFLVKFGSEFSFRVIAALTAAFFWPVNPLGKYALTRIVILFERKPQTDSGNEDLIRATQLDFDNLLRDCFSGSVLYTYRDVLVRYTGINITISNSEGLCKPEILFIGNKRPAETQNICLIRRNRSKLLRHRTAIRQEFVQMLAVVFNSILEAERIRKTAVNLVTALHDPEAVGRIEKLLEDTTQNLNAVPVQKMESQEWVTQE